MFCAELFNYVFLRPTEVTGLVTCDVCWKSECCNQQGCEAAERPMLDAESTILSVVAAAFCFVYFTEGDC